MIRIVAVSFMLICYSLAAQQSYTLKQALQTAASRSSAETDTAILLAEADLITARLRPNPKLNNQTLLLTNPSLFEDNTYWYSPANRQVWWQLTKTFQLPAQRSNKIAFAEQQVRTAELTSKVNDEHLLEQTASLWVRAKAARLQTQLLQEISTVAANLSVPVSAKEQERLRLRFAVQGYNLELYTLQKAEEALLDSLKTILGVDHDILITSEKLVFAPPAFDTAPPLAGTNTVSILQSELLAAETNVKLQRAMAWPQPELGFILNPQNTIPYAGIFGTIDLPFFSRNQGEIRKAEILRDEAENALTGYDSIGKRELEEALIEFPEQEAQLRKLQVLSEESQLLLADMKNAFANNQVSAPEYLGVLQQYYETEKLLIISMKDYECALVSFLAKTGNLEALRTE